MHIYLRRTSLSSSLSSDEESLSSLPKRRSTTALLNVTTLEELGAPVYSVGTGAYGQVQSHGAVAVKSARPGHQLSPNEAHIHTKLLALRRTIGHPLHVMPGKVIDSAHREEEFLIATKQLEGDTRAFENIATAYPEQSISTATLLLAQLLGDTGVPLMWGKDIRMVHFDLAAKNILFTFSTEKGLNVAATDYGISTELHAPTPTDNVSQEFAFPGLMGRALSERWACIYHDLWAVGCNALSLALGQGNPMEIMKEYQHLNDVERHSLISAHPNEFLSRLGKKLSKTNLPESFQKGIMTLFNYVITLRELEQSALTLKDPKARDSQLQKIDQTVATLKKELRTQLLGKSDPEQATAIAAHQECIQDPEFKADILRINAYRQAATTSFCSSSSTW